MILSRGHLRILRILPQKCSRDRLRLDNTWSCAVASPAEALGLLFSISGWHAKVGTRSAFRSSTPLCVSAWYIVPVWVWSMPCSVIYSNHLRMPRPSVLTRFLMEISTQWLGKLERVCAFLWTSISQRASYVSCSRIDWYWLSMTRLPPCMFYQHFVYFVGSPVKLRLCER